MLARLDLLLSSEDIPSSTNRVERVGLAIATLRADRAFDFDDLLACGAEESGEAGAVAARPFDRPHPPSGPTFTRREQCSVAALIGADHQRVADPAEPVDERCCVRIAMRVDTHDDVAPFCQHGHGDSFARRGTRMSVAGLDTP